MSFKPTPANESKIIAEATRLTESELTTFGDIAKIVFNNTDSAGIVGDVVYRNRYKIPYWYRIVNKGYHPVADEIAIRKLKEEGYVIHNGQIVL
ncbi:MAG: hypothetical protein LBD23_19920 [Oscillospiraceae bacterium]|jgi:alkylated DNA nucleotide flippase Atl1|nr:hypothetical protein [Oscillospiraceae bacterium]